MKIMVVTRGYPQEHNKRLGLFERDQALALKNAGHKIAYCVVDTRSIRRKRNFGFHHFVDENGIDIFEMNWPIGPMPTSIIEIIRQEALIKLYPHVEEHFGKPDIIHAHFLDYGVISVKLSHKENIPLVVTEHSSYLNNERVSKSILRRAKKTYGNSDAVISVSKCLSDRIYKFTGKCSTVIANIADVQSESIKIDKTKQNDEFVFASAGRLVECKCFDLLVEAFADVKKISNQKIKLVIYGDGPEKNKIQKRIQKLNISDSVTLWGEYLKSDIYSLFGNADAFVLPSRGETFGVVYIEALASGTPVIATKCGGPEDFITEDQGMLIDVDNKEMLVQAMLDMMRNRQRYDANAMMDYVEKNFSPEVIAGRITEVYGEVMAKRVCEASD